MLIDGYCDPGSWSTSTTLNFLMSLALQQVGWLSPTKPSTMILMGILYVIHDTIWFTWINWIIYYVIMWQTFHVVHICVLLCVWNSMMLCGSWFYQYGMWLCAVYMYEYIYYMQPNPVTDMWIVLLDITPHASALLPGPGYQNSGRSV